MDSDRIIKQSEQLINMLIEEMITISGIPKDFHPIYSGISVQNNIQQPEQPIGFIIHSASHSQIPIFEKINWIRRFMMKICLGLKIKYNSVY